MINEYNKRDYEAILLIENKLNYHFSNPTLLYHALTHSSYANERRIAKTDNNERLEFLGDAVLELVTSEYIFVLDENMPEGELTKLRASLVCEKTLAACAKELHVGDYLLLGKGEDATGGRQRESILSDALEAIIGAIYLDGGFANAKEFVKSFLLCDIEHKKLFYDSKTILQEIVQNNKQKIKYRIISEEGPDHNKKFTIGVTLGEDEIGVGVGKTKKSAEQEAAYKAILYLKQKK